MGSRYFPTTFHSGNGIYYSSSILYDCTNEQSDSTSSMIVESPLPVGNTDVIFIFFYFYSHFVSTILPPSAILDGVLTAPQCQPMICHWCITVFFSSTMLSTMPQSSVLFCVTGIATGNGNDTPSYVFVASLYLCGTTISILNCYPRIPPTKALFLVII